MKSKFKSILYSIGAIISMGNSANGQFSESFEASCSNYAYSFQNGCIANWFSASGTPDTKSTYGPPHSGSRYAHTYATWDMGCINPVRSEGIVRNYNFVAGTTYKLSYYTKGAAGVNTATQTYSPNWILTSGLTNMFGGACTTGEFTPNIPAGSQVLPTATYNPTTWTLNQHVFTATSNFTQLWFRNSQTTTVANSFFTSIMDIDDVVLEIICTPTPVITSPSSFCLGSPISFTGSAPGCPVANNVWTFVECTATGGAVAGAVEWWSPWAVGTPGNLTIPPVASGGPIVNCGKYYRIKLAVQNPSFPWVETSKIIYINCPPKFTMKGSTASICTGDVANLNIAMSTGSTSTYTVNCTPISPAGPTVYNGPLVGLNVSPTVTTTYLITVTDNATGCTSTMNWTVTVINNDPTFSLAINTTPSSYFTVGLTANDLLGYNNTGFYYTLIVEELDATNVAYYQDFGTNCWWNYPTVTETFQGYVSTGTGTYSQMPWSSCPNPAGQFLYNHTYRITRVVWNDRCPKRQFSMIITTAKSGNGNSVTAVVDHNAPDYTGIQGASPMPENSKSNETLVYPNPTTGKVTIELNSDLGGQIEIYNVLGDKVKSIQSKERNNQVDLMGFPKGIYLVKIHSNGEVISQKIILE